MSPVRQILECLSDSVNPGHPLTGTTGSLMYEHLETLSELVEGIVDPAKAERVAKIAQHRFGRNGWFISAKPTRTGNGVRINIFKPYGEKPKLPKLIQGVPVRIEKKRERPEKKAPEQKASEPERAPEKKEEQAPALPVAEPIRYVTVGELREIADKIERDLLGEAPLPATAGAPPGTPPKIKKPGEPEPASSNPLTADPALSSLTVAALNTGLKASRLKMKKGVAGQSGDILPDTDSDKADNDADKALDALAKIAQSKGIPKPRIKQLISREVPGPHGTTGTYRMNATSNKIELR